MPARVDTAEPAPGYGSQPVLLVLIPGMGMRAADFQTNGLIADVERRQCSVTVTTIDPGPDAYLDGSVEDRLLDGIEQARGLAGASRVWLAGISLGCMGMLRCVRRRPGFVDGLLLMTPYLATTGMIAEVVRQGGLRRWAASCSRPGNAEQSFLAWLGTTPAATLPRMLVGQAADDRFAATAALLAELIPEGEMITVPGRHDWASWVALWRLMLDRNPFGRPLAATH